MSRSPFVADDAGPPGDRRAGVFVLDADEPRRRAAIGLLTAHDQLRVLGAHVGSAAAVPLVVRALPHVCAVGPRVLAGPVPALVAELERVLPATHVVRLPTVLGVDPATLSTVQRARQLADVCTFVRAVLVASRRPAEGLEAAVREHFERMRPRLRGATAPDVITTAVIEGWPSP